MISNGPYTEAYVWIWLPQKTEPVVAGLLSKSGNQLVFNYGRSYLQRPDAIPVYAPELPLQQGALPLLPGLPMPGCIRDASPDAWGRRVLINRKLGVTGDIATNTELDELTYLLESGSDRIGALDFQLSPTHYAPRQRRNASLDELAQAAENVEKGVPLNPELDQALQHGTSLGGARPKVLIDDGERKFIAKFSATNDLYNVVKAEFIAMRLAAEVGLQVAPVKIARALGKDVLLVERFDRTKTASGWHRKAIVSALTIFELDEMMAAYASYEILAEIIRHRFTDPVKTLQELFSRIVFNILCGNTDDHARNHAAFWNGETLTLTPAYDICPQARSGNEASQAMLIHANNRMSQLSTCLNAAPNFLLNSEKAHAIIAHQIRVIQQRFEAVCDEVELPEVDRRLMWRRQFLNPFAFYGLPEELNFDLPQ
ncbi:type II toxin-antitoxin system HipA family toxin [Cellvibrio mixtus]|uniref:type II toxin-antitoxin system HipA family toxin n=1 Tax=Cellvibrio mixtus TaxID=39650 RepID=UPI00058709DA|nr:HipA domain-containing protein [Cellvibrio mixtus]